ncbi:hypothetical protein D3C80_1470340 [compost metagenome]
MARFHASQTVGIGYLPKADRRQRVAFGSEPCLHGSGRDQLASSHLVFEAQLGIIKNDQRIITLDDVTVMDEYVFDDPPFNMLDRFAVSLHGDHPRRERGTVEGGERRPGTEQAESHTDNGNAQTANFMISYWQVGEAFNLTTGYRRVHRHHPCWYRPKPC